MLCRCRLYCRADIFSRFSLSFTARRLLPRSQATWLGVRKVWMRRKRSQSTLAYKHAIHPSVSNPLCGIIYSYKPTRRFMLIALCIYVARNIFYVFFFLHQMRLHMALRVQLCKKAREVCENQQFSIWCSECWAEKFFPIWQTIRFWW